MANLIPRHRGHVFVGGDDGTCWQMVVAHSNVEVCGGDEDWYEHKTRTSFSDQWVPRVAEPEALRAYPDPEPFGDSISRDLNEQEETLEVSDTNSKHGYTCDTCSWGRDRVCDQTEYWVHMWVEHPIRTSIDENVLFAVIKAYETQRRGGEYPHLGKDVDMRRFARTIAEKYRVLEKSGKSA